jgi:hypothetical protein
VEGVWCRSGRGGGVEGGARCCWGGVKSNDRSLDPGPSPTAVRGTDGAGCDQPGGIGWRSGPMQSTGGSEQIRTPRSMNASIWLKGLRPTAAKWRLPDEGSKGTASCDAEGVVFVLFLLLMSLEDTIRGGIAIRRGVSVGDTDVENRGDPAGPESVDGNVATEFWGWSGVVGARHLHVPTGLDEWFVGDCGGGERLAAELTPLSRKVIVAL